MPLSPFLLWYWIIAGIIALATMGVLAMLLRNSKWAYSAVWLVTILLTICVLVLHLDKIQNILLPSQRKSSPPYGNIENGIIGLVLLYLGFVSPLTWIAPGFLFSCGIFPPKIRGRWKLWILSPILITISIVIPERMLARNREYMDDYRQLRQQRSQGGSDLHRWREEGPPDPIKGPTRNGHWRYLGCFPTYADRSNRVQPESNLVALTIDSRPYGANEFRQEAWQWIERAQSLKRIRFVGVLTDADIRHLKPLNNLEELTLIRTPITDAGFAELAELENLKELEIQEIPITGNALQKLVDFPQLRRLGIPGMHFSREDKFSIPGWRPSMNGLRREE